MNMRIKEVRKTLRLSQREFGEKLGVSRDVINNLEVGRVEPKDVLVKHICDIYSVNETWLRTGEGTMFNLKEDNIPKLEEAVRILKSLRPEFQEYALKQIRDLANLQKQND